MRGGVIKGGEVQMPAVGLFFFPSFFGRPSAYDVSSR